jgi:hypothetical protein
VSGASFPPAGDSALFDDLLFTTAVDGTVAAWDCRRTARPLAEGRLPNGSHGVDVAVDMAGSVLAIVLDGGGLCLVDVATLLECEFMGVTAVVRPSRRNDTREKKEAKEKREKMRLVWQAPGVERGTWSLGRVAFVGDGTLVACTSESGAVDVYDVASGRLVDSAPVHANAVWGLAAEPRDELMGGDGFRLVTCSEDASIAICQLASSSSAHPYNGTTTTGEAVYARDFNGNYTPATVQRVHSNGYLSTFFLFHH